MPTIPRRWPIELESERTDLIRVADEAALHIQQAQSSLDTARERLTHNPNLARVLIANTERAVYDALTRAERMRRYLSLVRSKEISGRWPMVAAKQREDSEQALERAVVSLEEAQENLHPLRSRIDANPGLAEAVIADTALAQARALRSVEQIVRLLTEAGIGRE